MEGVEQTERQTDRQRDRLVEKTIDLQVFAIAAGNKSVQFFF